MVRNLGILTTAVSLSFLGSLGLSKGLIAVLLKLMGHGSYSLMGSKARLIQSSRPKTPVKPGLRTIAGTGQRAMSGGDRLMAKDIESQFRVAVEELSRWVASAPIPHSSREWREQYLKLDAEVRRLSIKLDTVRDDKLNGAPKIRTQPTSLGAAVTDLKLTRALIVLLCVTVLSAANVSSAKASTPPSFRQTPLETGAKVHFRVVSFVKYRKDDHFLAQATCFFTAPGRGLTSRNTFENANWGALQLSSGNHVPIVGIVAADGLTRD